MARGPHPKSSCSVVFSPNSSNENGRFFFSKIVKVFKCAPLEKKKNLGYGLVITGYTMFYFLFLAASTIKCCALSR